MFTNNLVMFSFRSLIKILVGDQLQQRWFGSFHMVIPEPEHQDHIQHSLESSSVEGVLDRVGLETALYKKTSVPSLVCVLDLCVKIRQCDMLKFTIHKRFIFWIRYSGFWFNRSWFHEQLDQNKFKWFYVQQIHSIYMHA